MKSLRIASPLLALLALPAGTLALSLSGLLTGPSGAPLAGATVKLAVAGTTVSTGADGSWALGQATGISAAPRPTTVASQSLVNDHGHLRLAFAGANAVGQGAAHEDFRPLATIAARTAATVDTLLYGWNGTVRLRVPLTSYDQGSLGTTAIDTGAFQLHADGYSWSGLKFLTLGLVNLGATMQDSLTLRMFLQGKASQLHDFGCRVDIAVKALPSGFSSPSATASIDAAARVSHPYKLDSACGDSSSCSWAFDVPLAGLSLESGARLHLDLGMDRHKVGTSQPPNPVEVVYNDMMNVSPTHDIFDTAANDDWSFRQHLAGSDAGSSPFEYIGLPFSNDKNILDEDFANVRIAPYLAIFRKGTALYGKAP